MNKLISTICLSLAYLSVLYPSAGMAQNLVRNPGFESGLTPWVARGAESLATTTTMQSGAKGLWVTNRTVDWQGAEQSLLGRLRPGASYFCSAWVRAETTTSQPLRLTFEQRDGAGTRYFPVEPQRVAIARVAGAPRYARSPLPYRRWYEMGRVLRPTSPRYHK